jgi:methylated-DNA-[protein]-cysteine S-methyltransferase
MMTTLYAEIETSLGRLLLTSRGHALTGLYFVDRSHAPQIGRDWIGQEDTDIFMQTEQELREYAAGERKRFDVAVNLSGTPFQMRVWREINTIPFGHTLTYSDLAHRIGNPQSVRAVGTATGANPVSWIVPCHRVVGKSGALTGYAGGVSRKRSLLDFESAQSSGRDAILAGDDNRLVLAAAI